MDKTTRQIDRQGSPGFTNQAIDVVKRHRARFTSPSRTTPKGLRDDQSKRTTEWGTTDDAPHWTSDWGFSIDAPLLGNGDLIAALAGDPQWPQFWVTTNDFWDMKSDGWALRPQSYGGVGPRPLGRLVFEMPALADAQILTEQDFASATTLTSIVGSDGQALGMRSWVAATENLFVVEFTAESIPVEVSFCFKFPTELGLGVAESANPPVTGIEFAQGSPDRLGIYHTPEARPMHSFPIQEAGWRDGAFWATRTYAEDVDQPAMLALAGRFLEQAGAKVTVRPGSPVTFVASVRSWHKTIQPLPTAQSRAIWLGAEDIRDLRQWHEAWWRRFWHTSFVELDDPVLEQRYYLSHYVMGSLSRDPEFPPSIFGVQTWDDPGWCGDYKINYNHQAAFLGLYTAGHFEQADPHDAPYRAALDRGREMARRLLGHRGAHFPLGLGPKGLVCENGAWGMKSHNVLGLMNVAIRWYVTYDENYAWKVYPLIRAGVDFWEDDLVLENGRYTIHGDTAHETHGEQATINPIATIGLVRATLRLALSVSSALEVDQEKHQKWRAILEKLSDFPIKKAEEISTIFGVQTGVTLADLYPPESLTGKEVFCVEETGSEWSFFCAPNLGHIYPAGEIGLDSDSHLLRVASDTIHLRSLWEKGSRQWSQDWQTKPLPDFMLGRGAWTDFNQSCLFFPAAVRVGFDPELIWQELHRLVETRGRANGFLQNNPHGIENCSTVPNTIHEMMLLSHENILRFFKVWPRQEHPKARFVNLRAAGAFVVSADLIDGIVENVRIVSLKGRDCEFENPWPGKKAVILKDDEIIGRTSSERTVFQTKCGATYSLYPE